MQTADPDNHYDRAPMLVAGFGLLVMAALAAYANFGVFEGMIVDGEIEETAANITRNASEFRSGIVAFLLVAVLDVLVAWGLYQVLRSAGESISQLAAVLRYVYAAILLVATGGLLSAANLEISDDTSNLTVLQGHLDRFANAWSIGLFVFGIHLIVIGWLCVRFARIPNWIGWLVMIAGLGYAIDTLVTIVRPDIGFEFAMVAFIGEVVLMIWLIFTGLRTTSATA